MQKKKPVNILQQLAKQTFNEAWKYLEKKKLTKSGAYFLLFMAASTCTYKHTYFHQPVANFQSLRAHWRWCKCFIVRRRKYPAL